MLPQVDIAIDAMTIATVLLNFSFAVQVGAVLTNWQIGALGSDWSRQRWLSIRRLICISHAGIVTVLIAILMLETMTMAEVRWPEVLAAIPTVLTATQFGHTWIAAMGIALFNLMLHVPVAMSRRRMLISLFALAGFALSRSLVSHAAAAGAISWQVAIDALHLLLISVWLGEVVIAGFVMLRSACGPSPIDRGDCRSYVAQLSTSATIALVGIVATGVINSWRGIGSAANLGQLTDSSWGWILLLKVCGVALAAGLGALNRWGAMPNLLLHLRSSSLASVPAQRRFAMTLQIESVILTAVLFAAAMLSSSVPPVSF